MESAKGSRGNFTELGCLQQKQKHPHGCGLTAKTASKQFRTRSVWQPDSYKHLWNKQKKDVGLGRLLSGGRLIRSGRRLTRASTRCGYWTLAGKSIRLGLLEAKRGHENLPNASDFHSFIPLMSENFIFRILSCLRVALLVLIMLIYHEEHLLSLYTDSPISRDMSHKT